MAMDFEADKKLLTLRSKRVKVELTEEQREERRERMRKLHEQNA